MITDAWGYNHNRLAKSAAQPKYNILHNEFSSELHKALAKHNVTYKNVPPNMHRRNAAERTVRTFKYHLLAGLASIDPLFPITQYDRLVQQAEITLNLLHTS